MIYLNSLRHRSEHGNGIITVATCTMISQVPRPRDMSIAFSKLLGGSSRTPTRAQQATQSIFRTCRNAIVVDSGGYLCCGELNTKTKKTPQLYRAGLAHGSGCGSWRYQDARWPSTTTATSILSTRSETVASFFISCLAVRKSQRHVRTLRQCKERQTGAPTSGIANALVHYQNRALYTCAMK